MEIYCIRDRHPYDSLPDSRVENEKGIYLGYGSVEKETIWFDMAKSWLFRYEKDGQNTRMDQRSTRQDDGSVEL